MQVKKEVVKRVVELLQTEHNKCNAKLRSNKYAFKKLAEEQEVLKREKAYLTNLLRSVQYPEKNKIST